MIAITFLTILIREFYSRKNFKIGIMKKLLIATDLSANATHAAEYGYSIARQLKTNVTLCNACTIPAELPQAEAVVWPVYDYDELSDEAERELLKLKKRLKAGDDPTQFNPEISHSNDTGSLVSVINEVLKSSEAEFIVIGTHHKGFDGAVLGDHCRMLIDNSHVPLLLVPQAAEVRPVKKIAFASDLSDIQADLPSIHHLITLARRLNAEILLTCVYDAKTMQGYKAQMNEILTELSNKADYPHIYLRLIESDKVEEGLSWLCNHGHIDMLAMVHRQKNLFDRLFRGSHTQKMASRIELPLLVYPSQS
jgi:nucleotide-binding universal stress UspA family protein